MITIVFKNTDLATRRVMRVSGVRLASDFIYGVFNGDERPIASGTGSIWNVDGKFFNAVEFNNSNLKIINDDNDKAA